MAGTGARIQVNRGEAWARMRRMLRAQLRDTRMLLRESCFSLRLFDVLIGGGLVYEYPGTGEHPSLAQALHATFALIFFGTILPFPQEWFLEILFFLIPVIGLALVAEGVLRLVAALMLISEILLKPGSPREGSTVAGLEADRGVSVACSRHGRERHIMPDRGVSFFSGDRILVLVPLAAIQRVTAYDRGP